MTALATPTEIRQRVVAFSHELGFDVCRFAQADAPEHAIAFRNWLDRGAGGEMVYLSRNASKRCDPQQVLPGAKSVIALAFNYFQGERSRKDHGRIARYAWGEDYHDLLERKLVSIDRLLREHGGKQKYYVDTGPILERDYAAMAGVGWHGKSTMLLNRELGTWFFLAEILTTLEFAPDSPEKDRCGTCTRCIDACPTGAITAPHYVDARRCISYLTIELKGSIPLELRPLIGDRIYGCDDCLDACPWNRFARISRERTFTMPQEIEAMRLRDYLSLNEEKFRELFRCSPIKRTKRRGLLRNVCVALGNVGDADDLPALEKAALDPEPLIAEHARWAISQIGNRISAANA
jgi:epoxyqueuosine reductase